MKMTIQILGSGCAKCSLLETEAKAAVTELGLTIPVEKISDFAKIAEMGVMATPAIAIDHVVKFAGKVLTKDRIKQLIQEAGQ
jgi:small redox-active disulfide protein 2